MISWLQVLLLNLPPPITFKIFSMKHQQGLVGDLFVTKIAGAKAETEATLEEVKRVAEKARYNCRTYAATLSLGTILLEEFSTLIIVF